MPPSASVSVIKWRVRLSQDAETDFAQILTYTRDTFGEAQARIYQDVLAEALASLTKGPMVPGSQARDHILPDLRSLHVARHGRRGRHFVLYRAGLGQIIDVLRILHDAMDLTRHFPSEI